MKAPPEPPSLLMPICRYLSYTQFDMTQAEPRPRTRKQGDNGWTNVASKHLLPRTLWPMMPMDRLTKGEVEAKQKGACQIPVIMPQALVLSKPDFCTHLENWKGGKCNEDFSIGRLRSSPPSRHAGGAYMGQDVRAQGWLNRSFIPIIARASL